MADSRAQAPVSSPDARWFGAVFASLSVLAVAVVLFGTRLGIGLANDSINYMRAARGLLDGRGLVAMQAFQYAGPVPMTNWPPLYPLLLAAAAWLGLDMEAFARVLGALLLAANLILIGRFALDRGGGVAAASIAALLFATNREVLYVHQMVWTESLYLCTTFLALTLLARHLEAPRPGLVWGAGACAALAVMTRYVGIALVAAGGLALILLSRGRPAARLRDALRYALPACLALALWALRNAWVSDEPAYGGIGFRLPQAAPLLRPVAELLGDWLWPFSPAFVGRGPWREALAAASVFGVGAALALAAAGALRSRAAGAPGAGDAPRPDPRPILLLGLYALSHLAFLYGTVILIFDAFIPFTRHLLPAAVALLLALVALAARLGTRAAHPGIRALASVGLGAFVLAHLVGAARYQNERSRLGIGFREIRYTSSGLIALARSLPAGTPIFTNSQAVAGLGRMADMRFLPAKRQPQRTDPNPEYQAELRDMEREMRERHGVIIVFAGVGEVFPRARELERALPLRLLLAEPQGRAFAIRAQGAAPGAQGSGAE